jgi:hypothetical protein
MDSVKIYGNKYRGMPCPESKESDKRKKPVSEIKMSVGKGSFFRMEYLAEISTDPLRYEWPFVWSGISAI